MSSSPVPSSPVPSSPVPSSLNRILHFIYLSGERRFGAFYYLSMKTAFVNLKPETVYLYCDQVPETVYFKMIEKELGSVLKVEIVPASVTLCGQIVYALQHRADYIRLKKLLDRGGTYLDLDVLVLKPFDFTFDDQQEIAMGLERDPSDPHQSLCNAIIITKGPNSPFITEWLEAYEKRWGDPTIPNWFGHSTVIPMELAKKYPEKMMMRKNTDFYPFLWYGYNIFREQSTDLYPDSYAVHFFETEARKAGLIPETFTMVLRQNTPFRQLFEKYIPRGFPPIPQKEIYDHSEFSKSCINLLTMDPLEKAYVLDTLTNDNLRLMEYDVYRGLLGGKIEDYVKDEVQTVLKGINLSN